MVLIKTCEGNKKKGQISKSDTNTTWRYYLQLPCRQFFREAAELLLLKFYFCCCFSLLMINDDLREIKQAWACSLNRLLKLFVNVTKMISVMKKIMFTSNYKCKELTHAQWDAMWLLSMKLYYTYSVWQLTQSRTFTPPNNARWHLRWSSSYKQA